MGLPRRRRGATGFQGSRRQGRAVGRALPVRQRLRGGGHPTTPAEERSPGHHRHHQVKRHQAGDAPEVNEE